jgi:dipeptidyl aminopeptidase/acylaminoacyl peptidase
MMLWVVLTTLLAALAQQNRDGDVLPQASVRKRPVRVADAIGMTQFAEVDEGSLASFSPDGANVLILTKKGNLRDNTNEYSLLQWRTADLGSSAPRVLLSIASSTIRPAIQRVRWMPDNKTLFFLGAFNGELQQIYAFDTQNLTLTRLTDHSTNVLSYGVSSDGGTLVYTADAPARSIFSGTDPLGGYVVETDDSLFQLVEQEKGSAAVADDIIADQYLYIKRAGHESSLWLPSPILSREITPYVSPDGKMVAIQLLWDGAKPWPTVAGNIFRRRYVVIDLESTQIDVLLNSPIGDEGSEAAWSADSRSVVLSDMFLPLEGGIAAGRSSAIVGETFAVEVDVQSHRFHKLEARPNSFEFLAWDWTSNSVTLQKSTSNLTGSIVVHKRKDGNWEEADNSLVKHSRPILIEDEAPNQPVRLDAIDAATRERKPVFDPNPVFAQLGFSRVEVLRWKTAHGDEVEGGLYFPLSYSPGTRYPLVIQTHGFDPTKFMIDGPYPSAFAAQPLAGRGIMVFQLNNDFRGASSFRELRRESSKFESIVSELDKRRLIDPKHVGLIGWSRTCAYVKYALTHSKTRFAAASVQDGWDAGYWGYILTGSSDGRNLDVESIYDGHKPFGQGLRHWIKRCSGFNTDRVQTPVRIVAQRPLTVLGEWEWFSALSILGKPVEMVLMQNDAHELVKPWDRYISLEGNVDWFDFWLNGHEDPDPEKSAQYRRWESMPGARSHTME